MQSVTQHCRNLFFFLIIILHCEVIHIIGSTVYIFFFLQEHLFICWLVKSFSFPFSPFKFFFSYFKFFKYIYLLILLE